jgi:hypothetical protein
MKRRQLVDPEFVRLVEWTPELLMKEMGGTEVWNGELHRVIQVDPLAAISESLAHRLEKHFGVVPPVDELFELVLECKVRLMVWPRRPWDVMNVRRSCQLCRVKVPSGKSSDPGWWDGEAADNA